ncbi:MAG: AEC family transporter [Alkaliphilus sp.]|nr:AEC family transporter [Alkaliphilus sp.]
MNVFLFIITNNIIPIFLLIIIGYVLSKKFALDIQTIIKLNFYIFVPSFAFVNLYTTQISFEMAKVLIATIVMLLINLTVSWVISKIKKYDDGLMYAFTNSISFYNVGNIGIPLITLVFSSSPFVVNGETPYLGIALTAQIMVFVVQSISVNTVGFINAGRANAHWGESLRQVLRMPTVYVIPLAFFLKAISYDMTTLPIWPALNYSKNALVPIALIALGIQLSRTSFEFKNKKIYLSVVIRLLGGPILSMLIIHALSMEGIVAQVLFISSGLPTAVNTALIAVEYDNYPDFVSQVVMTSTLLSAVSIVFIIYAARILYPIM